MKKFLRNNGLSIVFFLLFILSLCGQVLTGIKQHNEEVVEMGSQPLSMVVQTCGCFKSGDRRVNLIRS